MTALLVRPASSPKSCGGHASFSPFTRSKAADRGLYSRDLSTVPPCLPPPTHPPSSFLPHSTARTRRAGKLAPRRTDPPTATKPSTTTSSNHDRRTATATTVRSCCDSGGKGSKDRQGGIWLLHDAQGLDMDDPVRSALIPSLGEGIRSQSYPTLVACGA